MALPLRKVLSNSWRKPGPMLRCVSDDVADTEQDMGDGSSGTGETHSYYANGNTVETVTSNQSPVTFVYDSQNRLVKQNAGQSNEIDITYDGAGNKVSETVGGVTTKYLIDTNNPTGCSQIAEEVVNGVVILPVVQFVVTAVGGAISDPMGGGA